MEIDIRYAKKGGLEAYNNEELLFYSTVNHNLFSRNIKVFSNDDILVLELKISDLIFTNHYKILFQNNDFIDPIEWIDVGHIYFSKNKTLIKRYNHRIISFYWNYYYIYEDVKVAQIKHNVKYHPSKMIVIIEDQNASFLNKILIHVLAMRTADPNDD
ncbi:hypothetical protein [uncultured Flavobacterium sp.]|uniref:hypothetical protein n=1 Tax=uncultured Flavobacterium sp. TaxID=165435 RepID=UPI0030813D42